MESGQIAFAFIRGQSLTLTLTGTTGTFPLEKAFCSLLVTTVAKPLSSQPVSSFNPESFHYIINTSMSLPLPLNISLKVKVKVTQSCPTLCDSMDYTGVGSLSFLQGIFPTQGSNRDLLSIAGGFFTI